MLFEGKSLQDERVPFVLKGLQENWDAGGQGGAALGLEWGKKVSAYSMRVIPDTHAKSPGL